MEETPPGQLPGAQRKTPEPHQILNQSTITNGIQHLPDIDYKTFSSGIQHLPDDDYKTFSSGIQHLPDDDNGIQHLPGDNYKTYGIQHLPDEDNGIQHLPDNDYKTYIRVIQNILVGAKKIGYAGYRLRFSSRSPRISHLCLWAHLSLSPTGAPYSFRYLKSTIVRAEAVNTGTHRDPRKVVTQEVVALVVALVAARLVAPETLTVLREKR
ncbi:hypothetical protein B5M09_005833 [Aphanomyces astaci]|uniref:Uncharacterized protein n=1 Tax=Aphanomyces astaci TaxID=112090 RepID=A0A3R7YIH7_APHAT|nr:hypothetical protein B5M09_005833 [Aphanomyces astaci]